MAELLSKLYRQLDEAEKLPSNWLNDLKINSLCARIEAVQKMSIKA